MTRKERFLKKRERTQQANLGSIVVGSKVNFAKSEHRLEQLPALPSSGPKALPMYQVKPQSVYLNHRPVDTLRQKNSQVPSKRTAMRSQGEVNREYMQVVSRNAYTPKGESATKSYMHGSTLRGNDFTRYEDGLSISQEIRHIYQGAPGIKPFDRPPKTAGENNFRQHQASRKILEEMSSSSQDIAVPKTDQQSINYGYFKSDFQAHEHELSFLDLASDPALAPILQQLPFCEPVKSWEFKLWDRKAKTADSNKPRQPKRQAHSISQV